MLYYRFKFKNKKIYSTYLIGKVKVSSTARIYKRVTFFNSTIKKYSYINENSSISYTNIGKFTSIGSNCGIGLPEHPVAFISTSPFTYSSENIFGNKETFHPYSKETIIGNDCWIGNNVIIMQGINIGDGAIIAAGAVVTKNVEPYSIVAGVPAKLIKYRFSQEKITILENLKWWNWSEEKLIKNKDLFYHGKYWSNYLEE